MHANGKWTSSCWLAGIDNIHTINFMHSTDEWKSASTAAGQLSRGTQSRAYTNKIMTAWIMLNYYERKTLFVHWKILLPNNMHGS
jgi:hypothetical protein